MTLMEGIKDRVVKGGGQEVRTRKEIGLSREKIREAIGSLKNGKAAGRDGVPSEVWKYGKDDIWSKWVFAIEFGEGRAG